MANDPMEAAARALSDRAAARAYLDPEAYWSNHRARLREEAAAALLAARLWLTLGRAERKVTRRDRKIAGLQRRIEQLEAKLAARSAIVSHAELAGMVSGLVDGAIKRSLANMRLVPVLGLRSDDKIVRIEDAK